MDVQYTTEECHQKVRQHGDAAPVNLDIEDGELPSRRPSGCGKSTLLRMIAGLKRSAKEKYLIGDEVMNDVVPARRGVAMVFQSYALYPHMTVAENMGYGLKVNKVPKTRSVAVKWWLKRCSSRTCWIVNRSSSLAWPAAAYLDGRAIVRNPRCLCSI